MSHRQLLILLGIALIALGLLKGGVFLILVWLGINFVALGIAHYYGWHGVFGKRSNGSVAAWGWLIFLPLLIYTNALWHLLRLASREPPYNVVDESLVVGRRLLPREIEGEFENYVDLTAEFAEPRAIRSRAAFICLPILDASAPTPLELHAAICRLRPGKTFIHCAQGHGRTGLFALAFLLRTGKAQTVEEGFRMLTEARPGIGLSKIQICCLQAYEKMLADTPQQTGSQRP